MTTQDLLVLVVDALEDIKAQNMQVFDTTALTNLFERVIICNGTSNRQTRALASHVREKVKESGGEVLGVEGEESGEWVLVDMGNIVVHIMQPMIRDYYRLEELWGATPVVMEKKAPVVKKVAAKKVAVTSADGEAAPAKKTVARKVPAKKVAVKKVAVKKATD
jgi:ribosome-associated protein